MVQTHLGHSSPKQSRNFLTIHFKMVHQKNQIGARNILFRNKSTQYYKVVEGLYPSIVGKTTACNAGIPDGQ